MSKKYLRAKEVAEKTGLALQTIYQFTSEKRIPYIKFSNRTKLYEEEAIEHWIETRFAEMQECDPEAVGPEGATV